MDGMVGSRKINIAGIAGTVLRCLLVLGMCVQILLGICWMAANFTADPLFEKRWELSSAARIFLYTLQLAAGLAAGYHFLKSLHRLPKWGCLLGTAAFATIPQVMQCHLAALPYSFVSSAVLVQLAGCVNVSRSRQFSDIHSIQRVLLLWMVQIVLLPEYWWLGLPVVIYWLCGGIYEDRKQPREQGQKLWRMLPGVALWLSGISVALFFGVSELVKSDGLGVAVSAASRTGWPHLLEDYQNLPEDIRAAFRLETSREAMIRADGMKQVVLPKMQETLAPDQVREMLWRMAGIALDNHTREIAKEIMWDLAAYHAPMATMSLQLRGGGYDSLSGRNYVLMMLRAPILTKWYVRYAGVWCVTATAAALILRLLDLRQERGWNRREKKVWLIWFLVFGLLEWMILFYTMRGAGLMDYKVLLMSNYLWYAWMLLPLGGVGALRWRDRYQSLE